MADIVFACPACRQNISCDEGCAGQQLQCPLCNQMITMPKPGGPSSGSQADNPLVPKPPGDNRLALNQNAQKPAATGNRNIPIRNLAAPAKKKEGPWKMYAQGAAVVLVLAVGAWFGWPYAKKYFNKEEEAPVEAAAPAPAPEAAPAPENPPGAEPAMGTVEAAPEAVNTNITVAQTGPAIPPSHNLEIAAARTTSGRVNGRISNGEFLPEIVRIDQVGPSQVLRFIQGDLLAPEREVMIYLRFKQGEKLSGQTLSISSDTRTSGLPQVIKRWKTNPRYAATSKSYSSGYAFRIEFGEHKNGVVKGKIYLALPDYEKSVISGNFAAVTPIPASGIPAPTAVATPAQMPGAGGMAGPGAEYGNRYR